MGEVYYAEWRYYGEVAGGVIGLMGLFMGRKRRYGVSV